MDGFIFHEKREGKLVSYGDDELFVQTVFFDQYPAEIITFGIYHRQRGRKVGICFDQCEEMFLSLESTGSNIELKYLCEIENILYCTQKHICESIKQKPRWVRLIKKRKRKNIQWHLVHAVVRIYIAFIFCSILFLFK